MTTIMDDPLLWPLSNMVFFLLVKLSSLYVEILSQENAPIFNLKRIKKCFLQGKCLFFPLAFLAQQLLRWALTHLGGNPSLQSGLTSRFFLSNHYKHQMAQWNIWVIFILSKYGHDTVVSCLFVVCNVWFRKIRTTHDQSLWLNK